MDSSVSECLGCDSCDETLCPNRPQPNHLSAVRLLIVELDDDEFEEVEEKVRVQKQILNGGRIALFFFLFFFSILCRFSVH